MPDPHAPGPLHTTARGLIFATDATGSLPGEAPDLAAVPAFLRDRVRTTTSSPVGSVGRAADAPSPVPDVAALPMAGIAPRRLVVIGATIILAWLVISFGRQVADASAASSRAGELRDANAALTAEVAAMERELGTIQEQRYVAQAARGYRLGTAREVPFALQANAPPLAADAPGSASVRLGADTAPQSPLERWLEVLFGPGG